MRNYLAKKRPIKMTAATKLQNAYRAKLAREEFGRLKLFASIPSTDDPYLQKPLIAKHNAKKTIKAFILRKAILDRKGKEVELDARQKIIDLFRRKKEQELIEDLRGAKQEKAFDTINNAILGLIAKKELKNYEHKKKKNQNLILEKLEWKIFYKLCKKIAIKFIV